MFSYDGALYRVLKRISDVACLHWLWLLCCLPVITAGASTSALYYAAMKRKALLLAEESDFSVAALFFEGLKKSWRQATILTVLLALLAAVLFFGLFFWSNIASGAMAYAASLVCTALLVPLFLYFIYAPPLAAWRPMPLKLLLGESLLAAYSHPAASLKLAVCWLLAAVINLTSLYVNIFTLLIGFGVFVNVFLSRTLLEAIEPTAASGLKKA